MALPCIIASPDNSSNIPWDPIDPMLVQKNGQMKNITVLNPYSYHHHAWWCNHSRCDMKWRGAYLYIYIYIYMNKCKHHSTPHHISHHPTPHSPCIAQKSPVDFLSYTVQNPWIDARYTWTYDMDNRNINLAINDTYMENTMLPFSYFYVSVIGNARIWLIR